MCKEIVKATKLVQDLYITLNRKQDIKVTKILGKPAEKQR